MSTHHQPAVRSMKRGYEGTPEGGESSPPSTSTTSTSKQQTQASNGSGPVTKKRITRKRAIMSCRNCTARKIRCEREQGAGQPCKACEKRGEGQLCDPGSTPGSTNLSLSEDCGQHRADLERRLLQLENVVFGQSFPPPHHQPSSSSSSSHHPNRPPSASQQQQPGRPTTANATPPQHHHATESLRAKSEEDNLSETEEAAMTLEDIAVNVRVSQPSTVRQSAAPIPSAYGSQTALAPPHIGTSRYRDSLIVPPISKRWRYVLEDLYADLPTRPKMDFLIHYYFGNVSWFWLPYHTPTFLAEYEAFHQLLREGRQLEVDPLWLSVLFLTLATAANSIDYIPPGTDFSYEELTGMFSKYFEDGRAALDCGDGYGSHARLRTIQAVVLLGPLALNSGDPGRVDILIPYVAATMRLAQQLGLDKLGSDPTTMPNFEDAALPPGNNTLRRELALRAFHGLCHIDQTTFRCRPVLPMHLVESDFPGNYNDQDLSPDKFSTPAPPGVRTISAYETLRFRVGMIQRTYHDTVVLDPSYTYSTVMHCDTEMRNLLEEYELERPEPNETTPMFYARLFSIQNINIRLIRFHRPFASKGYRDPAFRKSTDLALTAARVVLETQKELDRTQCPLVKDCYQLNHIQIAIVVLFSTIWYDQEAEQQPSADYRLINDSLVCFHRNLSSIRERVRNVARQSLLVVQCLYEALHNRATSGSKETYAQVLKRISMIVSDAERRAALGTANGGGGSGEPLPPISSSLSNGALPPPLPLNHDGSYPGGLAPIGPPASAMPPPRPPQNGGPIDTRSVLLDNNNNNNGGGPHRPQHPQQQVYPIPGNGQIYHRPNGSSSDSSMTPHDLHYDIEKEWGFEWMHLPQL